MTCSKTDALLVFLRCFRFHALENPAPALGSVEVVDLDADRAGIDGAGLARVFAVLFEFRRRTGA
jgi:hypothetical protein